MHLQADPVDLHLPSLVEQQFPLKVDKTSKDLKDSEKNVPHTPRILPSTSSAFGLSMAEEQDLPNSRIHRADLARWCSFLHSPRSVPIKSHMKSCCTALYICIMYNFLHDRCTHPDYSTNCFRLAAVAHWLLAELSSLI